MKGEIQMSKLFNGTLELANGVKMPQLGLGVYKMTDPGQTVEAITYAIETGYRAIDTAAIYENESETGKQSVTPVFHGKSCSSHRKYGILIRAMTGHFAHSRLH